MPNGYSGRNSPYQGRRRAGALALGAITLNEALAALKNGSAKLVSGTIKLNDGVAGLYSGVVLFNNGTKELLSGVTELKDGTISLYDGTVEIRDGAAKLLDGVMTMYDGTVELYDGIVTLKDGTFEFKCETEDLDTVLKERIDTAVQDVLANDFEVISFVSEKNKNVESVQFVVQTEVITIQKALTMPAPAKKN